MQRPTYHCPGGAQMVMLSEAAEQQDTGLGLTAQKERQRRIEQHIVSKR